MAETERTIEQQQVIAHRGGDLLVSASAGSGKTTVLIEHVLGLVLDPEHPVDIDRLLIATFTRAAAQEMRDRLASAIDVKIREGGSDTAKLRRQRLLIPHAHISTLDAFFGQLIRNHYQKLNIDPDFRIGDEGELKLLEHDVADTLFENRFREADPGFFALVDSYGSDKNDTALKEDLLRLVHFAESDPDPEGWLTMSAKSVEAGLDDPVLCDFIAAMKQELQSLLTLLLKGIELLTPIDSKILPNLTDDAELLRKLIKAGNTADFLRTLYSCSFSRLASIPKTKRTDDEWSVIDLRNTVKTRLDKLRKKFGVLMPGQVNDLAPKVSVPMNAFVSLALEFRKRFAEAKQEKNILDHSDVSQKALELLRTYHDIAADLRASFDEIIIDEFQDTNRLQEEILTLLSGTPEGRNNRFMVGDVKQSIYSFRMADPDIFQDKYDRYSGYEGPDAKKIDLNANFRSRREVLDSVNAVFAPLMSRDFGRVNYGSSAMLKYGAGCYKDAADARYATELILVEKPEDMETDPQIQIIAKKILELTDPKTGLTIYDKDTKITRQAEFRDIVILARAVSGISEDYVAALREEGIPAIANKKTGFFSAPEIVLLTDMLKVIDNPRQDIPLTAVLVSPLFKLREDLLLNTVLDYRSGQKRGTLKSTLYDALMASVDPRLQHFKDSLRHFQDYAGYHSIHELIRLILEETGYLYYTSALTDGAVRRANIEMLLERAIDFEATSYSGIFQFNRYLEQLKKYEIDYGEADVISERDNVVRILSVHQSKGLEYPIVILADTGHSFNTGDSRSSIPHHPKYGIRADYIDRDNNLKLSTLSRGAIGHFISRRSEEEELRILYVAMTRAREKLIIIGIEKKKKEEEGPGLDRLFAKDSPLPDWYVSSAGSHLDMIRMAVKHGTDAICVSRVSGEERERSELHHIQRILKDREKMEALDPEKVYDPVLKAQLAKIEAFSYPWQSAAVNRRVYAVSDLKKKASDREVVIRAEGDEGADDAARRGTAYHLLMSKADPSRGTEILYIKDLLDRLIKEGQIEPEIGSRLHPEWIRSYYTCPIGKRTAAAWEEGRLYREKPFILGKNAEEVDPTNSADDMVMVKGVIDNFFLEDDGIVLIDYKTDSIRPGDEQVLINRYRTQLEYYAAALENAFKQPVKEMYLYSFVLGKAIEVKI